MGEWPSLRRVDARFVLPLLPRRVAVVGSLPAVEEGLRAAGVDVVAPGSPCDATWGGVAAGVPGIVEGARVPGGRSLLAPPSLDAPRYLIDPAYRHAAAYAGRSFPRLRRVAPLVLLAGARPPGVPRLSVAGGGEPAVVAAARSAGLPPDVTPWYLTLGAGGVRKRAAFVLFAPGARRPAYVVKFTRLPSGAELFDRDEAGLAVAASAGALVTARAPALLGRGVAGEVPFSVETALAGVPLTALLPGRIAMAEAVVRWLDDVARATALPPSALDGERARLAARGIDVPQVPAVFQHHDLWPDNVLVDGDDFTLVDWEHARQAGFPLWDLVFFAAHALAGDGDAASLFGGRARSSPVLFRWVRAAAASLGLPGASVGPLVAAAWHEYGERARAARLAREAATGGAVSPYLPEALAAAWRTDPALGPGWGVWQS